MARKLQVKVIHAFEVLERVGTGLYKLKNISNDELVVLPADQLIRTRLTLEEIRQILQQLEI